jgi:acetyl-CoA synthetase
MANLGIESLDDLQSRAEKDTGWFWESVLGDLGIEFYEPYERIVDLSDGKPWAKWCVGGSMNIVHNCLDRWMGTPVENRTALCWEGEGGDVRTFTYRELNNQVCRLANALRSMGLRRGDVIGLYMPMIPEIAVALLATVKLGGIVLPLFSGYGAGAIASRLADADARALFTADGFCRRGKVIDMKSIADEAISRIPSLEHLVVTRYTGGSIRWNEERDHRWNDLLENHPDTAETERTGADDTMMLIYTSGTTGRPKGAVHTHCGFPIKAAQDMAHGFDLKGDDTLYWITDMGWMMGPWEVFGTLILGSTMLFSDGAPDYPGPDRLWSLVDRHGVTVLGVSPTLIRSLMQHGSGPVEVHDLSSLRIFGSTGEPWNPDPWHWLFRTVGGGRLPIINYSGGTEISGGIVMGNLLTPLKPCAFSGPAIGMAADVVDEVGNPVRGEVGEMIIRQPWIGMTRGFWKDPDRYIETYWSRIPDIWVHGDFSSIDEDGLWYIHGRSDDTIKVAGKRIGPAEIESILVGHPDVIEAAVIGVPDPIKGEEIVGFCVLQPGVRPDPSLADELTEIVARDLGKPLKPRSITFLRDLPKTRNAKVMRRVIRSAYLGEDPGDLSALVNPESLEEIKTGIRPF